MDNLLTMMNGFLSRAYKYLSNGNIKALVYDSTYLIVSRTNLYYDDLRYAFAKIQNRNHELNSPIIEVNGNLMYIDFKDNGISKQLYIHRKREHLSTDYIQNFIDGEEIIIDIGSNIGYYALIESKLASKGKVYAVEPIPSNINMLNKNIKLNDQRNITVFQLAMGDNNSKGKMYVYDKCNWCSFTKDPNGNIIDEIEVPIMTLDNFIKSYMNEKPTFIRMDAEGYEYQILKGASDIIEGNSSLKFFIELHPHLMSKENMDEIITTMKKNNFKIASIFIEIEPHNYKSFDFLNKLTTVIGIPKFGATDNSYDNLESILEKRTFAPMVFFERSSSN